MRPKHDNRFSEMPACDRAASWLRSAIADGRFAPGMWLPPERNLAEQIGTGRPAVREALVALQREGILDRIPGGRPRVAAWAGSLGTQSADVQYSRRSVVAALIPQPPTYAIAHAIQSGVGRALGRVRPRRGLLVFDTYLTTAAPSPDWVHPEIEALHRLEAEGVAGVVVWGAGLAESEDALLRMQRTGTGVVFVDHRPTNLTFDFVGVDNRAGMREAVRHLVGLGHRRIAFVSHPTRQSTIIEREEGYLDELHEHGLRHDPALLFQAGRSLDVRAGEALRQFKSLPAPPTAIVAVNDLHAFELLRAAQASGLRVPEDISVVGFDDAEQFSPHPSPLTTVRQPFREIGFRAGELLLRRISEKGTNSGPRVHILLTPTLTIRASTTSPPTARRRKP